MIRREEQETQCNWRIRCWYLFGRIGRPGWLDRTWWRTNKKRCPPFNSVPGNNVIYGWRTLINALRITGQHDSEVDCPSLNSTARLPSSSLISVSDVVWGSSKGRKKLHLDNKQASGPLESDFESLGSDNYISYRGRDETWGNSHL